MARRRLLTDEQWAGLLALPRDERDIVRHCTLTPDDLAVLATKRATHNRLGHALLLCAMRHPGRILEPAEVPPAPMVAYVARQVGADPSALEIYAGRVQTRREQIAELMCRHGFLGFGPPEAKLLLAWLTPIAQINRKPAYLVATLLDELQRRRIQLLPPLVAELVVHHARTRAERITYRALTDGMDAVRTAELDSLLASLGDVAAVGRLITSPRK